MRQHFSDKVASQFLDDWPSLVAQPDPLDTEINQPTRRKTAHSELSDVVKFALNFYLEIRADATI